MATLPTIFGASPLNADDATRLLFFVDTDLQVISTALDNMPSLFETMNSLSYQLQWRTNITGIDDSIGLSMRVMNGSTVLAAADLSGGWITVKPTNTTANTTDQVVGPTSFGYVNTTASKATWDGASVELRQHHSRNMGSDGVRMEVDVFQLTGTYTPTNTPPNTPVITAPADSSTISGTVDLTATVSDPDGDNVYARWELVVGDPPGTSAGTSFSGGSEFWAHSLHHDGTYLYVMDTDSGPIDPTDDTIRTLNPATGGTVSTLTGLPGTNGGNVGVAFDGVNFWVLNTIDSTIYEVDPVDASEVSSFAVVAGAIDLTLDGNDIVVLTSTDYLYRYDKTGFQLGFDITGFNVWTGQQGIAYDPDSDTFLILTTSKVIKHIWNDSDIDEFSTSIAWSSEKGIAYHNGIIYVVESGDNDVHRIAGFQTINPITPNTTTVTSGSSHTTSWDTTLVPDGTYFLQAYAVDALDDESTLADSHTITIDNSGPPPAVAYPDIWDGAALRPGTEAFVWDGTALRPVTSIKVWDGTALRPVT